MVGVDAQPIPAQMVDMEPIGDVTDQRRPHQPVGHDTRFSEPAVAVTINAAEMLGLDDRIGSLETGKQATLLITTGNPLDTMADIEQAFIQGRELDMNDIQKHFFEKYMTKLAQRTRVIF